MSEKQRTARRVITIGAALLFVALGFWLMLYPGAVEELYPVTLNDPMAFSEVRAIFGGMMLGIGVAVLALDVLCKRHRDAALVLAIITGGLVLARLVGFYFEGWPKGVVLNEVIFEFVLLTLLITLGAFRRSE
jgi:hypothetical protein